MKIFGILFLVLSCKNNVEKIHDINVLDYYNFKREVIRINQIQDLYHIDNLYSKKHFEVANTCFNDLDVLVTGDLFDVLFEKCFLKDYNDDDLNMNVLQDTSELYYLGKFYQSEDFQSQIFLLKITDKDNTFFIDKMLMLNSKNSLLLSVVVLSDYLCSEGCVGRKSKKKKNGHYNMELMSYSSDVIEPPNMVEEIYFAPFKLNEKGYLEPIDTD